MKSKTTEKALIVIALLLVVSSVYYLFFSEQDLLDGQNKKDAPNLAVLETKTNLVRQKQSGSVAWKDLSIESKLYHNDQVFTQEDAYATLKFNDGSKLEMAPKTLIRLDGNENDTQVNLLDGLMLAKMSETKDGVKRIVSIKTGNTSIKLESAAGEIQIKSINEGADKTITVLSGSANVEIDGQKLEIKKDEAIKLDGSNNVNRVALNIFPLSPRPQQEYFFTDDAANIEFQWRSSSPIEKYTLSIASEANFENPIITQELVGQSFTVNSLAQGSYYWKVSALGSDGQTSQSSLSTFRLQKDLAPKLITPIEQEKIQLVKDDKEQSTVLIKWEKMGVQNYEWQLLKGSRLLKTEMTGKNSLKVKNLSPGPYDFKVRIKDSKRPLSPWSETRRFYLNTTEDFNAPKLLIPSDGEKISIGKNFDDPINFKWEYDQDNNATFNLEVSLDSDFTKKVLTKKVNADQYQWQGRTFGQYYWRVALSAAQEEKIQWSKTNTVNIVAAAPALLTPENEDDLILYEPGPVDFTWSEVFFENPDPAQSPLEDFYWIEASTAKEFESFLFKEKTPKTKYTWNEPEFGDIYWRTKANPANSEGVWSTIYRFNLRKSDPPPPPELSPIIRLDMQFL